MKSVILIISLLNLILVSRTSALNWCESDSDCLDGSKCKLNICECEPGKILNKENSKCVSLGTSPDFTCEVHEQCSWINGPSECKRGYCGCKDGYRYLKNVCVYAAALNSPCQNDDVCYDGKDMNALVCKNNECVCNKGYYDRGGYDCRPIAQNENDTCVFNIDCDSNKNLMCVNGKCIINVPSKHSVDVKYVETLRSDPFYFELNQTCSNNSDCSKIKNTYCVSFLQKCVCNTGFTFEKTLGYCVPAVGEKCVNNTCELQNAECMNGICQCKKYYMAGYLNEKCYKPIRVLGYSCARDNNCFSFGTNSICENKICACSENSQYDSKFYYCKSMNQCEVTTDCVFKKYSDCIHNHCICQQGYTENENQCIPNLGYLCESKCNVKNSVCNSDHICACETGFLANGEFECVKKLPNFASPCIRDVQCRDLLGPNSFCEKNSVNKCKCKMGNILVNEFCVPFKYLGDACSRHSDCVAVLNSTLIRCRNGICSCEYDYTMTPDRKSCLRGKHFTAGSHHITANILLSILSCIIMSAWKLF